MAEEFADIGRARGLRLPLPTAGRPSRRRQRLRRALTSSSPHGTPGGSGSAGLNLDAIRILVLDEADRMLDMGFQPQVDAIVRRLPRKRQTMFFSATLDGEGRACAFVHAEPGAASMPSCRRSSSGGDRHRFVGVTAEGKVDMLVKMLNHDDGLTLVFVRTKRRSICSGSAVTANAAAMHGDMGQGARERALAQFESGKVATLVAPTRRVASTSTASPT